MTYRWIHPADLDAARADADYPAVDKQSAASEAGVW